MANSFLASSATGRSVYCVQDGCSYFPESEPQDICWRTKGRRNSVSNSWWQMITASAGPWSLCCGRGPDEAGSWGPTQLSNTTFKTAWAAFLPHLSRASCPHHHTYCPPCALPIPQWRCSWLETPCMVFHTWADQLMAWAPF